MSLKSAMSIAASGLAVQRTRMDVVAANIANMHTTRTADGGPYRRQGVALGEVPLSFAEQLDQARGQGEGVEVTAITEDPTPFVRKYDPGHPDADADGFVLMPNVDLVQELTDLIAIHRAYESSAMAFGTARNMAYRILDIGR